MCSSDCNTAAVLVRCSDCNTATVLVRCSDCNTAAVLARCREEEVATQHKQQQRRLRDDSTLTCNHMMEKCILFIHLTQTNYYNYYSLYYYYYYFSLKKVGDARLRECDLHPISPKIPAP